MSSLDRSLAGPFLTFSLDQQIKELRGDAEYHPGGRVGKTLAKSGRLRVVLVAMDKGNVIHTHQADSPLTIQVLQGTVSFRMDDGAHNLQRGDVLFFGPGDAHDITAHEPSALLLTISAIGDDIGSD